MAHLRNPKLFQLVLVVLGLLMAAISAYLTNHYYQIIFPQDLRVGVLCDISQFWNCDAAALSPLGNIFNVPTSLFGVGLGLLIAFGGLLQKESVTRTNFFLAIVNLVGCIFLLGYSLFFLHGLCPGCTIYYVLSLATVIVFFFVESFPPIPKLSTLFLSGFFVLALLGTAYGYNYERFNKQDEAIAKWIEALRQEELHNNVDLGFDFPLQKSTTPFADAPLRITVFSDFQCPWCKVVGEELTKIGHRYRGRINIRYIFFPLDPSCNNLIKNNKHPLACAAARLSYCAKDQFRSVHDDIYDHQQNLSYDWLLKKAEHLNVTHCFESEESKNAIKILVDKTDSFPLDGVPTLIINERKLSGMVPTRALIALLDALLSESKKNNSR